MDDAGLVTVDDSSPDCGGVRRYCELDVSNLEAQMSVSCCNQPVMAAPSSFRRHRVAHAKQCLSSDVKNRNLIPNEESESTAL